MANLRSTLFLALVSMVVIVCGVLGAPDGVGETGPQEVQAAKKFEGLKVPTLVRACTNSACNSLCVALGYYYGVCADAEWCYCYIW